MARKKTIVKAEVQFKKGDLELIQTPSFLYTVYIYKLSKGKVELSDVKNKSLKNQLRKLSTYDPETTIMESYELIGAPKQWFDSNGFVKK